MKSVIQGAVIQSGSSILDIVVQPIILRRKLFLVVVPPKCVFLMLPPPFNYKVYKIRNKEKKS